MNGHCAHPLTDTNGDVYNMGKNLQLQLNYLVRKFDTFTKNIVYFVGFSIGPTGMKYQLLKIPFSKNSEDMLKNGKVIATMSPRWSGQMGTSHSFGMTENYLVFVEQPYTVSAKRIAASFVKGDCLKGIL